MQSDTYGCHNRPEFKTSCLMQDGWIYTDGTRYPVMVDVPFRMETLCQYTLTDLGQADPKCHGCKWRVQ